MTTASRQTLGRYLVEAEIGRGAMGVVYRARDPRIERLVAIKTISLAGQEEQEEQEYRDRFIQEARAAGRLSHPGIVTIHDAGEDPESHEPFFVMEYVAGQPLSDVVSLSGGKLAVSEALKFACEIADALQYAHERAVIHGDIKPANILITTERHAKIADFGVARLNQSVATHAGKVLGSPAYMAPEQLAGREPDARSDLFSLGVMLYGMLTGFRPFQGNSAETVCFKVMNVEPVPVSSFQAELPPELDQIVSRAIAKSPDQRYQSGAEMAAEIRAFARNDQSIADATMFFTRVLERDRENSGGQRLFVWSKRLFWQAGAAVVMIAWILTAWEMEKQYKSAENLAPPSPHMISAPAIEKTRPETRLLATAPRQSKVKRVPQSVVSNARLQIEILHHFPSGKASVWLDSQLVLDQELKSDTERHGFFRVIEMNQTSNLEFAPGKHKLIVHIVAPDSTYDETDTVEANLTSEARHLLYVNCDKKKLLVRFR